MKRLSLFILSCLLTVSGFAQSLYVCQNGTYTEVSDFPLEFRGTGAATAIVSSTGTRFLVQKIDSITGAKPNTHITVDFSAIAKNHTVNGVYVMNNSGVSLKAISSAKSYCNSQSVNIIPMLVSEGATQVDFTLGYSKKLSKGITITVRYDNNSYLTLRDETPIGDDGRYDIKFTFTGNETLKGAWMACLPDQLYLNNLSVSGSHNTAATSFSAVVNPIAKCQHLSIPEQLEKGCRVFDIRPRYTADNASNLSLDNLEIFHGQKGTGKKFKDAMDELVQFVTDNPTETVIVILKAENSGNTERYDCWRESIRTYLTNNKSKLLKTVTTATKLGDVRGKIVVMSRNGYGNSDDKDRDVCYGCYIDGWGDDNAESEGYLSKENWISIADCHISDHYNNGDESGKAQEVLTNLTKAASSAKTSKDWYITNVNVQYQTFHGIDQYATTINGLVCNTLRTSDAPQGRYGIVLMDYIGCDAQNGTELMYLVNRKNFEYLYEE